MHNNFSKYIILYRQLEEKLRNANDKGKSNSTDCSVQTDLNISIDVACETARVDLVNVFTQTEPEEQVPSYVQTINIPYNNEI